MNVILPSTDPEAIAYVQSTLDSKYRIYMVYGSATDSATGQLIYFTRLSAQVYVQMSDFELLAELVPKLLSEY